MKGVQKIKFLYHFKEFEKLYNSATVLSLTYAQMWYQYMAGQSSKTSSHDDMRDMRSQAIAQIIAYLSGRDYMKQDEIKDKGVRERMVVTRSYVPLWADEIMNKEPLFKEMIVQTLICGNHFAAVEKGHKRSFRDNIDIGTSQRRRQMLKKYGENRSEIKMRKYKSVVNQFSLWDDRTYKLTDMEKIKLMEDRKLFLSQKKKTKKEKRDERKKAREEVESREDLERKNKEFNKTKEEEIAEEFRKIEEEVEKEKKEKKEKAQKEEKKDSPSHKIVEDKEEKSGSELEEVLKAKEEEKAEQIRKFKESEEKNKTQEVEMIGEEKKANHKVKKEKLDKTSSKKKQEGEKAEEVKVEEEIKKEKTEKTQKHPKKLDSIIAKQ